MAKSLVGGLPVERLYPTAAELPLAQSEVMRLLGYKEGRTRLGERHLRLVDEGIELARAVVSPAASIAHCALRIEGEQVSTAVPGLTWHSRSLARLLEGATGVSLVVATLGPGLEALVQELFAQEAYALATVVDAAGSAMVQGLSQYLSMRLAQEMTQETTGRLPGRSASELAPDLPQQPHPDSAGSVGAGPGLTPLFGPGYGDWSIYDQGPLVAALGGEAIGLSSTETCYLQPQKSLVGLIGWLPPEGGRNWSDLACTRCTMPDCAYRVRPAALSASTHHLYGRREASPAASHGGDTLLKEGDELGSAPHEVYGDGDHAEQGGRKIDGAKATARERGPRL